LRESDKFYLDTVGRAVHGNTCMRAHELN